MTDDERAVRDAAGRYCQSRLLPRAQESFRHERTDPSIFREMGQLGLLGPTIPEEYGGAGFHVTQFAREIAGEVGLDECINDRPDGIGFACRARTQDPGPLGRAVLALLACLAGQQPADVGLDHGQIVIDLPALLHSQGEAARRLSDTALVKLFRLLRLTRRLLDLETGAADPGT